MTLHMCNRFGNKIKHTSICNPGANPLRSGRHIQCRTGSLPPARGHNCGSAPGCPGAQRGSPPKFGPRRHLSWAESFLPETIGFGWNSLDMMTQILLRKKTCCRTGGFPWANKPVHLFPALNKTHVSGCSWWSTTEQNKVRLGTVSDWPLSW